MTRQLDEMILFAMHSHILTLIELSEMCDRLGIETDIFDESAWGIFQLKGEYTT